MPVEKLLGLQEYAEVVLVVRRMKLEERPAFAWI